MKKLVLRSCLGLVIGIAGALALGHGRAMAALSVDSTPDQIVAENVNSFPISGTTDGNVDLHLVCRDRWGETVEYNTQSTETGTFEFSNVNLNALWDGPVGFNIQVNNPDSDEYTFGAYKMTSELITPTLVMPEKITASNAANFTISGEASGADQLYYYFFDSEGNGPKGTLDVVDNQYSSGPINLTGLLDGTVVVVVGGRNSSLGQSSQVYDVEIIKDSGALEGPSVELDPVDAVNLENQNSYIISGTTAPNATVNYSITDGVNTIDGSVVANGEGNFEITLDLTTLNDGEISLTFVATDSNNISGDETIIVTTKDTVAPGAPSVISGDKTGAGSYGLEGISEPNAEISYYFTDGVNSVEGTVLSDEDGNFSKVIDLSGLADGDISLSIKAADSAGNVGEITGYTITKSSEKLPSPVLTSNTSVVDGNTKTFSFSGTAEPNSSILFTISDESGNTINGSTETDSLGFFTVAELDLSELLNGTLTLSVSAVNEFSNPSDPAVVTFIKNVPVSDPASDPTQTVSTGTSTITTASEETSERLPETGANILYELALLLAAPLVYLGCKTLIKI